MAKEKKETKFCQHCGAKIDAKAEICPKCGVRVKEPQLSAEKKNPAVAAILSFLINGLGQVYNGQIGRGIAFFIIGIILFLTIFVLIGVILYPLFWIYNVYDAYETANKINRGELKI